VRIRFFVLWVAASCVLSGCGDSDESFLPPDRIFLITIDTLRADHLGTLGYPRGLSPFLDGLATKSVLFTDTQSSISHTAPSLASMFTGLQPAQHQLSRNG
jgi:glucan phosphoethanolaminetransferase (alkaline phosphatase superfamily)